jgi:uncharacterized repeat protein (TIGR02543 family)
MEQVEAAQEPEIESAWFADGSVPRIMIGNLDIPLYAPAGVAAWSLMNLVLSVICALFAAIAGVRLIVPMGRRRREFESEFSGNANSGAAAAALILEEANTQRSLRMRRPLWFVVSLAAAVAGAVLFLLTQDMSTPMVLFDWWTVTHAVLVAAGIVSSVLTVKIFKEVVTFETNGGSRSFKKKIRYGDVLGMPRVPTRQGYAFAGWYTDSSFQDRWDFNRQIDNSLTLYAKWNRSSVHSLLKSGG